MNLKEANKLIVDGLELACEDKREFLFYRAKGYKESFEKMTPLVEWIQRIQITAGHPDPREGCRLICFYTGKALEYFNTEVMGNGKEKDPPAS